MALLLLLGIYFLPFKWFTIRFLILLLIDFPLTGWLNISFIRTSLRLKNSIFSVTAFYLLVFSGVYLALYPSEKKYYLFVLGAFLSWGMISLATFLAYQKNIASQQ